MEKKKVNFFKRTKDAVTNFDEYKVFIEEEKSVAIKYISKLVFTFSLILTICIMIFFITKINKLRETLYNELPDIRFENNNMIMEGDVKQYIKTDSNQYFELIVASEVDDINSIEEAGSYKIMQVAFLKDKMVMRNLNNQESILTYEELNERANLNEINKQSMYDATQNNNMILLYIVLAVIVMIAFSIAFTLKFLFDILLLTLVAFLFSRIMGMNLKYRVLFNICTYSIVLSIILNLVYMCVRLFTGFEIRYFDVAYNTISYIYIITAMFLIKSDLIKQKIEVQKIIEVQKEVRQELEKQEKEKKEEKNKEEKQKNNNNKEKKKNEKKEKNNNEEPQGNQA